MSYDWKSRAANRTLHSLKIIKGACELSVFLLLLEIGQGKLVFSEPITYTYDSLNRLTEGDYGIGKKVTYTYDVAGNRTGQVIRCTVPGLVMINIAKVTDAARQLNGLHS